MMRANFKIYKELTLGEIESLNVNTSGPHRMLNISIELMASSVLGMPIDEP